MGKPVAVVVNGYGTTIESPLGQVYLPRVLRLLERVMPDLLIFCGGHTYTYSSKDPSEAEVMCEWMKPEMSHELYVKVRILNEEHSFTTLGNSIEAAKLLRFHGGKSNPWQVIHCCEATRSADVIMCDRHAMVDKYQVVESIADITVETASWELADPMKQAKALVYNSRAIRYPWLGLFEYKETEKAEAAERRRRAFIAEGK